MKDVDLIAHLRLLYHHYPKSKDAGVLNKAMARIEATRWRKLCDEKPTKNGLYEVLSITHFSFRCEWSKESNSFIATEGVKWWRPIVGPEDNNE